MKKKVLQRLKKTQVENGNTWKNGHAKQGEVKIKSMQGTKGTVQTNQMETKTITKPELKKMVEENVTEIKTHNTRRAKKKACGKEITVQREIKGRGEKQS